MITHANLVRRVAALSALLVFAAIGSAGAQSPATGHWDAWLGCWRASLPAVESTPASLPNVCVARTTSASAIEISTI